MQLITWNEKLSVEISELDQQHQHLIALINELHEARLIGQGRTVIGKVLDALVAYTRTHFTTEERLMDKYGYPGLTAHRKEHEAFIDKVGKFHEQYTSGNSFITTEVTQFIRDWVVTHIQGIDQGYSAFLIGKGVK